MCLKLHHVLKVGLEILVNFPFEDYAPAAIVSHREILTSIIERHRAQDISLLNFSLILFSETSHASEVETFVDFKSL